MGTELPCDGMVAPDRSATPDITMMLVGNKTDLAQARVVSTEDGKSYSGRNGISFMEASALTVGLEGRGRGRGRGRRVGVGVGLTVGLEGRGSRREGVGGQGQG